MTARIFTLAAFTVAIASTLIAGAADRKSERTPEEHFRYGSIGAELMPLSVFQVLPDLFPESFTPGGNDAGDWIDQFGFIRGEEGVNDGLPVGFAASNHLPKSGIRTPIRFVGFTCALCHEARIRRVEDAAGTVVVGMGNPDLDLVPFGDAVKSAVLDEKRLTVATIDTAYRAKYGKRLSVPERLVIRQFLTSARKQITSELPLRALPFSGAELRDPEKFPSGPARIMAPRETVRRLTNQTPLPDGGPSKFPSLYHQDRREWAQFDGSIRDKLTRNSIAATGVGATIQNLKRREILQTIRQSYQYIAKLDGPKFATIFPDIPIDARRSVRGREMYLRHCGECHGAPGASASDWIRGTRQGEVIPVDEIRTDPARVKIRFYDRLARLIFEYFPDGHPLKPKRDDLRATHGYITAPIESVFSRAPFLHNASVPTLAELINLKPRRNVFYRGRSRYDPVDVGIVVAERPDAKAYYRYDATQRGNWNGGHDYPWEYRGPGWDAEALKDLLEYLKTL